MYVAMVEVPAVEETYWPQMMYTRSKSCIEPMTDRNAQTRIVGPSSGRVIQRWICQYEAPSMAAASYSSSGMLWIPASIRITAKPMYFQEMITINVQMAMFGSAIQSTLNAPSPIFVRRVLTAPWYWSMRPQPVPTITSLITYGMKMSTRITERPRMFWSVSYTHLTL